MSFVHRSRSLILALVAVFVGSSALAAPPPGYYSSAEGKSGTDLRNALHAIIDGHTVIPYTSSGTDTEVALKVVDQDPNNSNNVLLLYKGTSVAKSSFGTLWNREHTWPQSRGADAAKAKSDMHHLFAEDPSLNSSRGNSIYNTVGSPTNQGFGNKWTNTQFEVRDAKKGDVARAILYMDIRYEGTSGEPNLSLTNSTTPGTNEMAVLTTLLAWHAADPVDADELARMERVASYQNNRNPFIDRPEFVNLVYGGSVTNGNTVSVATTNRAPASVNAGAGNVPMLTVSLTANANEWDLSSLQVSEIGSLASSEVTEVRLYRDTDNSGSVTANDVLLDTKPLSGGSATLTCGTPSRVFTTTANFLITASVAGSAPNGQTLQLQVNANTITSAASGGTDTNPTHGNLASGAATVANVTNGDSLIVSSSSLAPAGINAGATNVAMLTFTAAATANEWDLSSVGITRLGTSNDTDVPSASLYFDADNSSTLNAGDVLIGSTTFSGGVGTLVVSPTRRILTATQRFILVTQASTSAINNRTVSLRVDSLNPAVTGGTDNAYTTAFSSGTSTISGVSNGDSVTAVPTNRAPSSALAGSSNTPLVGITLTANSNEWDLGTLSVTKLGTLGDANVSAVRLFVDVNSDGTVDDNDAEIATTTFSSGTATFTLGASEVRATTLSVTLLVTADIGGAAPNGATLGLRVNANGYTYQASGGADINPTTSAFDSNLATVSNTGLSSVMIVTVATRSTLGATYEYIVLANNESFPVNITGWEARTLGGAESAGAERVLAFVGTIPAKSHFLAASPDFGGTVGSKSVDFTPSSTGLFAGTGIGDTTARSIGLFNGTGSGAAKIDGFSWASGATNGSGLIEAPVFTGSPSGTASTAARQVIARKRPGGSTGPYTDTASNSNDLEIKTDGTSNTNFALNSSDVTVPVAVSHFSLE